MFGKRISACITPRKGVVINISSSFVMAGRKGNEKKTKAQAPSPGAEKMPEPKHKATAGARILLSEDNDLNREIAQALLDMRDIWWRKLSMENRPWSCFKAVQQVIIKPFYGHQNPIMDGYEATERIRHVSKEGAGIPIIAMTANAFDEDVKQAKEVGMSAYFAKSIDPDLLACTLEQWLLKWQEELMLDDCCNFFLAQV